MRRFRDAFVLLAFVAVSFVYFGVRLVPHPGRALLGVGIDPQLFVWAFAWWPHAVGSGENPLVTHAVYWPQGINLAWATTTPALALVFAPVTLVFGPAVAYNLAAVLMPALAAWTAYLLCRHLTGSTWASLIGGHLFGFSGYMLGQELGHLNLTSVFLIPLVALVVVRHVEGTLDGRGLAIRLGLLVGIQLWITTEVALTSTVTLVAAVLLALVLVPERRARLRSLVRPLLGGYGLAALIASPLLLYALIGFYGDSINEPARFNGDLLNVLVPTRLVAAGGSYFGDTSASFSPASDIERGAYLGLPTLLIVVWYAIRNRRSPPARLLVASFAVALLFELGTALYVGGHKLLWLPWDLVARLPLFNNVLPARFAVFASLAVAVIVALWTASEARVAALVLPALAVLALVPAVWRADYRQFPERWPFFTSGLYKICFPEHEAVAIFPFGFRDNSMLWQAESGFWFDQGGGYLRPKPPPDNLRDPVVRQLTFTYEDPTVPEILEYAKRNRIDRILSVEYHAHPPGEDLKVLGPYQLLGGMLISPGCGYPAIGPRSKVLSP